MYNSTLYIILINVASDSICISWPLWKNTKIMWPKVMSHCYILYKGVIKSQLLSVHYKPNIQRVQIRSTWASGVFRHVVTHKDWKCTKTSQNQFGPPLLNAESVCATGSLVEQGSVKVFAAMELEVTKN